MAGCRCSIVEALIIDHILQTAIDSAYRVTRDWLQVKAAGQLRDCFVTTEQ